MGFNIDANTGLPPCTFTSATAQGNALVVLGGPDIALGYGRVTVTLSAFSPSSGGMLFRHYTVKYLRTSEAITVRTPVLDSDDTDPEFAATPNVSMEIALDAESPSGARFDLSLRCAIGDGWLQWTAKSDTHSGTVDL